MSPDENPDSKHKSSRPRVTTRPSDDSADLQLAEPVPTSPRSGPHSDAPGHFELVLRVLNPEIDPGETLEIEGYVTGYGQIQASKLFILPPPAFLEADGSTFQHSLGFNREGKEGEPPIKFGAVTSQADTEAGVLTFLGIQHKSWSESSYFVDIDVFQSEHAAVLPSATIITEMRLVQAPLVYRFKTRDGVAPGQHHLQFVLTYFDGQRWRASRQSPSVKVSSWLERNQTWLTVVGTILTLAGLGAVFL